MTRNLSEHILKTASELFYQHGIQATGIDAIVKASGVAKMSLYKYYPSKNDLILAYLQHSAESFNAMIINGLNDVDNDKQKLLKVFDLFAAFLRSPDFRGCPFINASAEFSQQAGPIQQAATAFYENFADFLEGLAANAGLSNSKKLASQLSILIAGAVVREQMQANSGAMQQALEAAEILINTYEQAI